jgi:hypothetical protein
MMEGPFAAPQTASLTPLPGKAEAPAPERLHSMMKDIQSMKIVLFPSDSLKNCIWRGLGWMGCRLRLQRQVHAQRNKYPMNRIFIVNQLKKAVQRIVGQSLLPTLKSGHIVQLSDCREQYLGCVCNTAMCQVCHDRWPACPFCWVSATHP